MSNATKCRHPCMGPSHGEGEDHLWFNFRISHLAWTNKWYILTIFSWLSRLLKIILYSTELKSILRCWTLSLNTLHCRICSWVSLNKKQVLHHMLSLNDDFWLSLTLIVLDLIRNKVLISSRFNVFENRYFAAADFSTTFRWFVLDFSCFQDIF